MSHQTSQARIDLARGLARRRRTIGHGDGWPELPVGGPWRSYQPSASHGAATDREENG